MNGLIKVGTGERHCTRWEQGTDLWVFQLDVVSGFEALGQIAHDSPVRRSLRIGDKLYSVSESMVMAHPIHDPSSPLAQVPLQPEGDDEQAQWKMRARRAHVTQ